MSAAVAERPPTVRDLDVAVHTVPTSTPVESDGTQVWDSTTMVDVEVTAGAVTGLGYTYGHPAVATVVTETLADVVRGRSVLDVRARNTELAAALRNAGRPGIGAHAVSAVDVALWDAEARHLGVSLVDLLGAAREAVPGLSAHVGAAAPALRHVEYFHDHVRIEGELLDGVPALVDGCLLPDRDRPAHGLEFRDAERGRPHGPGTTQEGPA